MECVHQCDVCEKHFANENFLSVHKKWQHERKSQIKCEECLKTFPSKYNLKRHKETVHSSDRTKGDSAKLCALCSFSAGSNKSVVGHYQKSHNLTFQEEVLKFESPKEFEDWKKNTEIKSKSQFVKKRSPWTRADGSVVTTWSCHRDGNFVSSGKNIRHLKTQGSSKINAHCPARLEVMQSNTGVVVKFIKTHVGHDMDLGHLRLMDSERAVIAQKLAMKVSFDKILDEVRDSVVDYELNRIHLLNRRDLWNIANSFNVNHDAILHKSDCVSVDAWVHHMNSTSSTVRLYKPQGVLVEEYPELKSDDFLLLIMNDAQKDILAKYGEDCVCIDSTHGLNAYDFQLFTLMVIDDMRQGFPCAFLFSNRGDTVAMEIFFKTIRECLNRALTPKTFMSDLDETFYNAWSAVNGHVEHRLFCIWHVDRAWRSNLQKIKSKEDQALVYKQIKMLMIETDEAAFTMLGENLLAELSSNTDTLDFANYFKKNYWHCRTSWAYCYRIECGINTNMNLESMHKVLKYFYFDGKKVKRMDKAIHMVMKFIRDKLFDRLIVLNKGKVTSKLSDLRERHQKAVMLSDLCILENEDCWAVQSSQNRDIYTVKKNNSECQCQLRCTECEACIHAYSCTCIDSSIKWNMCKHSHLVCIFLKKKKMGTPAIDICTENSIIQDHQMVQDSDDIQKEVNITEEQQIVQQVSGKRGASFDDKKKQLLEKLLYIHSLVQNEEEIDAVLKQVAPTESIVLAMRKPEVSFPVNCEHEPPNKKIKTQQSFFSTKKKRKTTSNSLRNPTETEVRDLSLALILKDTK